MEPFTAVPDRVDDVGLTRTQQSTYRMMLRVIRRCNSVCDWPVRRLASACGVSESTFERDIRVLKAKGLIAVEHRKVPTCSRWNNTNLYSLPVPVSVGGGVKNEGEKQAEKDLKTTTPARENPRDEWEARWVQDREDHNRMREQYETVGRTIQAEIEQRMAASEENRRYWREGSRHRWTGGRQHRMERAEERNRRAMQANVGVYTGDTAEMSEEQRLELLSKIAANERKEREKLGCLTAGRAGMGEPCHASGEASLSVLPPARPQPEG